MNPAWKIWLAAALRVYQVVARRVNPSLDIPFVYIDFSPGARFLEITYAGAAYSLASGLFRHAP